jgi:DNA-binding MarR family transcriptional regulator
MTLDDQIVVALRRISQAIDQWSRQLWQDFGLTSPQLATLREIAAGKNVSPGTLATALHVSQPTVTGILQRLEERGLVSRVRSAADRRSVVAELTDRAREILAEAPPLLRDRFRAELARLPDWQQTELLATLQRVAEMMHAPEVEPTPYFFHEPPAKNSKRRRSASTSGGAPD